MEGHWQSIKIEPAFLTLKAVSENAPRNNLSVQIQTMADSREMQRTLNKSVHSLRISLEWATRRHWTANGWTEIITWLVMDRDILQVASLRLHTDNCSTAPWPHPSPLVNSSKLRSTKCQWSPCIRAFHRVCGLRAVVQRKVAESTSKSSTTMAPATFCSAAAGTCPSARWVAVEEDSWTMQIRMLPRHTKLQSSGKRRRKKFVTCTAI